MITAFGIARRRWAGRGGDPDDITTIAMWAVPAGLVGARLYHVITDWPRYEGRRWDTLAFWEGGLGIPGGLAAGVLAGLWIARRRGLPAGPLLDIVAPAIPVAQAMGRLGNWFNQELFGRPTHLPWGLEIDPAHRPTGYADIATFLYEALWNLALAAALLLHEHRRPDQRPGRLFALSITGYAAGRLWVEALRIDPATHLLGVRVNLWTSGTVLLTAAAWLIATRHQPPPEPHNNETEPALVDQNTQPTHDVPPLTPDDRLRTGAGP